MGQGLKEFENYGDVGLVWHIYMSMLGVRGAWDKSKMGRAVAELDRRINRS